MKVRIHHTNDRYYYGDDDEDYSDLADWETERLEGQTFNEYPDWYFDDTYQVTRIK